MIKRLLIVWSFIFTQAALAQNDNGRLEIHFVHQVNGQPLILHDSTYVNDYHEKYTIRKLKYYLTDFRLDGMQLNIGKDPYVLIDANQDYNMIRTTVPAGNYHRLQFKIGVDSIDNCSGSQTGALDPTNDMFWTWNSGYVFLKLEGNSDSSKADLNRFEYHLGGYKSAQQLQTTIDLTEKNEIFSAINIPENEDQKCRLIIVMDLNRFWGSLSTPLKISEMPLIMKPGIQVDYFRNCFKELFRIQDNFFVP